MRFLLPLWLVTAGTAAAQTGSSDVPTVAPSPSEERDPIIRALQWELNRSMNQLSLPDAPGPYFVSYLLYDTHDVHVTAQLGGVVSSSDERDRTLGGAVRVGDPSFDSANFDAIGGAGFGSRNVVPGDHGPALRHDAWLLTDDLYKDAVENLSRKQAAAQRRAQPDPVPDFAPGPAQTADAEPVPAQEAQQLTELARSLSAVFLTHPQVEWSIVYAASESGRRIHLDSLGTRVVEPVAEVSIRAVAVTRAEDGSTLTDQVLWVVRTLSDLPPTEDMLQSVHALAEGLEQWRALPAVDGEYVGPVLFEGDAAVDLFRHLLIPALQGTPEPEQPPRGSRTVVWDEGEGSSAIRVRRRILPSGFEVEDDPTADPSLPSAYRYDFEGEPAQNVKLVEDGVVRSHYATRTPSKDVSASNGHGRTFPGRLVRGTASWLRVSPAHTLSSRKLHRQAIRLAQEYEQDHYIVLRKLTEPSVDGIYGGPSFVIRDSYFGSDGGFPHPVVALRVYADGREERVRGLHLSGISLRTLRDIVGSTDSTTASRLLPPASMDHGGATYGLPTTLTVPNVLVSEVELSG
ncbi:MAG: metallopeptidase TldD-related protein, partial [Myxococcota bacterium]|nr:metallopeptidase TldD-related protein [Myxococcota bacterium]